MPLAFQKQILLTTMCSAREIPYQTTKIFKDCARGEIEKIAKYIRLICRYRQELLYLHRKSV